MHCKDYLNTTAEISLKLDHQQLEKLVDGIYRTKGRIFVIGLGGSYANSIHMAADLRKLCNLDAHAMNPAELTARANDDGMASIFTGFIRDCKPIDTLFVLSVGGGTDEVSPGIAAAVKFAKDKGAGVLGITGPNGGVTAQLSDCCIKIPATGSGTTPHTEAFQAVIWHCIVSHPLLQRTKPKWP